MAEYHQAYCRRHGQRSMSRQNEESKAQSSSEPRAPPRGNDVLFSELEEGQVDYDEPMGSEAYSNPTSPRSHTGAASSPAASVRSNRSAARPPTRRDPRTPHPFSERSNPIRALRDAPPLSSRYDEEDRYDHNVITNDLDEAQGRQLSNEQRSQSFRPVVRPLVLTSRRDYGFQTRNPVEATCLAAQRPLNTYTCGPAASTADEQVQRHRLRERYLTPQVTTPREYQARLQMQLNREPVPSMRAIPVVLNPGESHTPSNPGPRPHHHEASPPFAHAASAAHSYEPAATATGRSLISATDLSSLRSSGGKRSAPDDAVVRHSGGTVGVPDQKGRRRQGSPVGGQPQTPKRFVSEDNPSISQGTAYDPGACVSPLGVPHGSGDRRARRAEQEKAEPQLDSRVASRSDVLALEQRVGSLEYDRLPESPCR
ncbi:hypothetical protein PInf_027092 [Phytophthora infestans]|nr:hypothetical protein PInf_027092 [Phytophthora infestans]